LIPGRHERTKEKKKKKCSPSVSYPEGTLSLMEIMPAPRNQVEENFPLNIMCPPRTLHLVKIPQNM
jgi:hypothetical protein